MNITMSLDEFKSFYHKFADEHHFGGLYLNDEDLSAIYYKLGDKMDGITMFNLAKILNYNFEKMEFADGMEDMGYTNPEEFLQDIASGKINAILMDEYIIIYQNWYMEYIKENSFEKLKKEGIEWR